MTEQTEKPYKELSSGGYVYQAYPVTGRACFHLDRKVTDIFCLFKGAKTMGEFKTSMIGAFGKMDDDELDDVIRQTLVNVVRVGNPEKNEQNIRVTIDNVYDLFAGDVDGLYGLLFALWGAYNLTPFAIAKKAKAARAAMEKVENNTGA